MSKTFSHAGVSTLDGVTKVRFCNDALRQKVLIKNGHTNIDIIELMSPMSKEDIVAYLISIDFAQGNKTVQAAIESAVEKRAPKAASKDAPKKEAKKPKKVPAPKAKAKPTMEAIKAKVAAKKVAVPATTVTKAEIETQLTDLENQPF